MEWSQILCCLEYVGFTKTNTELFVLRHITTLTSIQVQIIFLIYFCCLSDSNDSTDSMFSKCWPDEHYFLAFLHVLCLTISE